MENKPILEIGKRDLEQTKKIVVLQFMSLESRPQLRLSSSLTPNPSHIFHNQRITKEKSFVHSRILVRVDVYPIHLHLPNFLGIIEPYFAHTSFKKIISL